MIQEKKLYRSLTNRKIAGVCGGIGEYFNIDPTLVRLAAALLALSGSGALVYFIAWFIIPEEPAPVSSPPLLPDESPASLEVDEPE